MQPRGFVCFLRLLLEVFYRCKPQRIAAPWLPWVNSGSLAAGASAGWTLGPWQCARQGLQQPGGVRREQEHNSGTRRSLVFPIFPPMKPVDQWKGPAGPRGTWRCFLSQPPVWAWERVRKPVVCSVGQSGTVVSPLGHTIFIRLCPFPCELRVSFFHEQHSAGVTRY